MVLLLKVNAPERLTELLGGTYVAICKGCEMGYVKVNKDIIDGTVAVLYSLSYNEGWSTKCSDDHKEFMLFDKKLVTLVWEGDEKGVEDYLHSKGIHDTFDITALGIEWIPIGKRFRIVECDGYERIEFDDWFTA